MCGLYVCGCVVFAFVCYVVCLCLCFLVSFVCLVLCDVVRLIVLH